MKRMIVGVVMGGVVVVVVVEVVEVQVEVEAGVEAEVVLVKVHARTHARVPPPPTPPPQNPRPKLFSHCFLLRQPLFLPLFSPYRGASGGVAKIPGWPGSRSFAVGLITTGWANPDIPHVSFSILSEHRRLF
jgi:hypothetical protein